MRYRNHGAFHEDCETVETLVRQDLAPVLRVSGFNLAAALPYGLRVRSARDLDEAKSTGPLVALRRPRTSA